MNEGKNNIKVEIEVNQAIAIHLLTDPFLLVTL